MGAFTDMLAAKRKKNCSKGSLLVAIGALAIRNKLDYEAFRLISEWLGIYSYIQPDDRDLDFDLLAYLLEGTRACILTENRETATRRIFRAYLLADIMESCFTDEQQYQVVQLLYKDRKESVEKNLMPEI